MLKKRTKSHQNVLPFVQTVKTELNTPTIQLMYELKDAQKAYATVYREYQNYLLQANISNSRTEHIEMALYERVKEARKTYLNARLEYEKVYDNHRHYQSSVYRASKWRQAHGFTSY